MTKALLYELGRSTSFGRLSLLGKVFWPMLLAASDDQGRGLAELDVLKWQVCANVEELTIDNLPGVLVELEAQEMIRLYADHRERPVYQVIRWWEFQQLAWAQPSRFDAPADWTDRARYHKKGVGQAKINWECTGGFGGGVDIPENEQPINQEPGNDVGQEKQRSAYVAPTLEEGSRQSNLTKLNSTQGNSKGEGADAPPLPPPPEKAKASKPKPKTRAKPPPPPAVARYRAAAELYPKKTLWPGIVQTVGDKDTDLERWEKTCLAWVAMGWNPKNVKGMLEHFQSGRIPGDDGNGRGARASPNSAPEPAGYAGLREWIESEGDEWPTAPLSSK